jgi:uncharacterized membrane protein YphA (DoxX/SURF4 family)
MSDQNHPELHINEEPRNDFADVAMGFGVFFGILLLIGIVATAISITMK